MSHKITIEKFKFDEFCANFKNGKYGKQRFGQAFFNEFRLDKSSIETYGLWNKDGEDAKKCIQNFVEFN